MASAPRFSGLEATGFGFGFQIMFLQATGFGFGFLNFKMEANGFGFGLGFLSTSWLRPWIRSHQPGFQPNLALEIGAPNRSSMLLVRYIPGAVPDKMEPLSVKDPPGARHLCELLAV